MEFFKIVLIIIAVYYGLKLLARILLPFLLKKLLEKYGISHNQQYHSQTSKEGEVNIKDSPKSKKKYSGGEYVSYEEVK